MSRRTVALISLCGTVFLTSLGAWGTEGRQRPATSRPATAPAEAFALFVAAARQDDIRVAFAYSTERARNELTLDLSNQMALCAMGDKEWGPKAEALLKRHQKPGYVEPPPTKPDEAAEVVARSAAERFKDPLAFCVEAQALLVKMGRGNRDMPEARIEDVKIEGDRATGRVRLKGVDEPGPVIGFRKINGGWLVDGEEEAKKTAP